MRPLPVGFVLAVAPLVSACGGGGGGGAGGGGGSGRAFVIHGRVVTRGATLPELDGVRVDLAQTGESRVTGPDGGFVFESDRLSRVRLRFSDPAAPRPVRFGEADGPVRSDTPVDPCDDGLNAGPFPWFEEDDADLGDLSDASEVRLEVELDAGVVTALRVLRESTTGVVDAVGVGSLEPLVFGPEGLLQLHVGPDDVSLWVDLAGLATSADYEVLLSHPLAGPPEVAPFTTTLCGTRRLALVFALGEPPPPETVVVLRISGGVDVALGALPSLDVSVP
jgi:hypothetical protein